MKRKFNIQQKIQIYILSAVIVILLFSIGYMGLKSRTQMVSISRDLADSYAREYANLTSEELQYYSNFVFFVKSIFEDYSSIPLEERRDVLSNYMKSFLEDNSKITSVWSTLEPNAVDNLDNQYENQIGSTALGNFNYVYLRRGEKIELSDYIEQNTDEVYSTYIYSKVKSKGQAIIVDPVNSMVGLETDNELKTKIAAPVFDHDRFMGIVGTDVMLNTLDDLNGKLNSIEGSFGFIITQSGTLINFPDSKLIGKNISDIGFHSDDTVNIQSKLAISKEFVLNGNYRGESYYVTVFPIKIEKINTVWYAAMALPESEIIAKASTIVNTAVIIALIGIILLFFVIYWVAKNISRPIKSLTSVITKISMGEVSKNQKINLAGRDEITEMANAMNYYIEGYAKKVDFASGIGAGKLEKKLELLSEDDLLGKSLMQMRDNLIHAKEEELKRKVEDKIHRWTNEGVAKFADILRQNNDNISELSFELMRNLVNYLEVNQGAIFVLDESKDEAYYDATSTIAFNKKQFSQTRFKYGEDLIGRCAHERKTIYLKQVPENYISITSGMGEANPNVILLVPAILNDKVYAIIELASFNEIKDYQIEFIEKIGESVASTIANVKVSERTQQLLKESQYQQEELGSQEEEMRQNLEELQTTQEEAARREFEMRNLIEALSIANYMVEYNMNGVITEVNERFAKMVGMSREQIIGMNHNDGLKLTGLDQEKYRQFWEDLRHGITRSEETHIAYNQKDLYLYETYTPLIDQDDKPYKVVKIAVDITEKKQISQKLEEKENELGQSNEQINEIKKQKDFLAKEVEELKEKTKALTSQLNEPQKEKSPKSKAKKVTQKAEIILPPAGKPLIDFKESMQNPIVEMNEQHLRIAELADAVYIGLRTEKPKKDVKESLKMLVDFSAWHFSNEERYFAEFSFENEKEHTTQHKEFHDKIAAFSKQYQAGKIKFYDETMQFIKDWIETHFSNDDQLYVNLFKSKGIK